MADSQVMATKRQCEAALRSLAKRLDGVDASLRKRHAPDRTVTCRIPDLDTTFSGRLHEGALLDISNDPLDDAQIRLTVSSDDLLAVTNGELAVLQRLGGGTAQDRSERARHDPATRDALTRCRSASQPAGTGPRVTPPADGPASASAQARRTPARNASSPSSPSAEPPRQLSTPSCCSHVQPPQRASDPSSVTPAAGRSSPRRSADR